MVSSPPRAYAATGVVLPPAAGMFTGVVARAVGSEGRATAFSFRLISLLRGKKSGWGSGKGEFPMYAPHWGIPWEGMDPGRDGSRGALPSAACRSDGRAARRHQPPQTNTPVPWPGKPVDDMSWL